VRVGARVTNARMGAMRVKARCEGGGVEGPEGIYLDGVRVDGRVRAEGGG
jgi:hypothetical protein